MLALAVMAYGAYAICYERSQYAELLSPSLYVDVGRIMIVVSLISVVNSLIAIYSVMKELRCLIYSVSARAHRPLLKVTSFYGFTGTTA